MRIRHSRLTKDFLQVPNATVRDDRMSHMARGILVELLSRPDGWKATADDMWQASVAKHGKASPGRRQFRAAFAELKEYGYLRSERELLGAGQHATILIVSDVSAAQSDVPHAGTSAPPAETQETPGRTDVPHGGTSEAFTDVPDAGTSERPAETGIHAAQPDVPTGGTSAPPAETGISAGHSDVPHGGTSTTEHWTTNTGKNTSSPTGRLPASTKEEEAALHLDAFGAFWVCYPKKLDRETAQTEWITAMRAGVDPALIVEKAQGYARSVAGETNPRWIAYPANWLSRKRYFDEYPELPADGRPALHAVGSPPSRQQKETDDMFDRAMARARARDAARQQEIS
ncbi:hypothetical protein ACFXB3_07130 [Streptomyces sp. NPDC059447]|uniref:hypothetical protein n=1 Tax=Streptomyces sp. NPDC059447 TaxID=3346834 RepID=UPI00367F34FB